MHEPMGDPSALTRVNVGLGITMTFLVLAVQVRPCSGIFLRNVSTNRLIQISSSQFVVN